MRFLTNGHGATSLQTLIVVTWMRSNERSALSLVNVLTKGVKFTSQGIYAWLVERVRINSSRIRQERERKVRDAENRRMVEILKQFPSHEVEMHIHEEEGKVRT